MPFPTLPNMPAVAYRGLILDHYWPELTKSIKDNKFIAATNKEELRNDYAAIGAFLTNRKKVFAALEPLEAEIRKHVTALFPKTTGAVAPLVTRVAEGGEPAHFKSDKLLSNALLKTERLFGFNHEKLSKGEYVFDDFQGTLHAGGGTGNQQGAISPAGPSGGQKVKLAGGVPSVVGPLDPLAFTSVLIKHGYQFKDVAAGPYHGEYTHRLQWHAIMQACLSGALALKNTPLEIFKSMGYMSAKATDHVPGGRHLWMWEALFDTAENDTRAAALGTAAHTTHGAVFTCPENFTKSLMNLNGVSHAKVSDLWCLRVLVKTRWKKRFDENDGLAMDPVLQQPRPTAMAKLQQNFHKTKLMVSNSYTTRADSDTSTTTTFHRTIDEAGYALVWYLRRQDGVKI